MRARNTLIMAVLVVVLGALVYFLEFRGVAEREEADRVAERLLHFESEEVTGVTITTSEETISLARIDDEWRISAPYDLAANQSAVTSIVNGLQTADHVRVIDEAPEDLERFGLAEPEVSVMLQLADGSSLSLALGAGTPVGFNVFARPGDGDTVYTTAASIKDTVNKTLFALRDRSIMTFVESDVARIDVAGPDIDVTVERQPNLGDGITRWALRQPLEASADTSVVSALVGRLGSVNALAFPTDTPTDEQLAEYGLDDAELTVRVWTGDDAAHTLQIGGLSEQPAGRYARRLGSDAVMIVSDDLISALPESADALRNRTVVAFARDRVNAIELDTAGAPLRLEKDGIDWRISEPRPLDGDAATVAALLSAALDLQAREFAAGVADSSGFGFASPHARVSFELEALPGEDAGEGLPPETVTLLVGAATELAGETTGPADPADEDATEPEPVTARYVRVDGEPTVYVVEEEDLDDITVDLFAARSKTLVSFGQSNLTRIELSGPDGEVTLTKSEDGSWARGSETVADEAGAAIDDMLWSLNYLNMQSIVVEPQGDEVIDLSPFGLATPAARVRAFVGEEIVADVFIECVGCLVDDQLV